MSAPRRWLFLCMVGTVVLALHALLLLVLDRAGFDPEGLPATASQTVLTRTVETTPTVPRPAPSTPEVAPGPMAPATAAAIRAIIRPASSVSVLVNLLISKILMRYPGLKIVLAESGLGWGAYLLEYTDFQATGDQLPENGYDLMPSELFKRQCYLVGWYDRASLRVRDSIGTENILWSSQFPQATSTWPNTKAALEKSFVGVVEGDKRKILWENAATLYKIAVN